MQVLAFKKEVENLLVKCYIRNNEGINSTKISLRNEFDLSGELLNAILQNEQIDIHIEKKPETTLTMIEQIGSVVNDRRRDRKSLPIFKIYEMTIDFEEKFAEEPLVREIAGNKNLNILDRVFFYDACYDHAISGGFTNLNVTLLDIYDDAIDRLKVAESFMTETHPLIKEEFLEFSEKESLIDAELTLTQKSRELLLGENHRLFEKPIKGSNLLKPEEITQKTLFYNSENEKEIARLTDSLQDENLAAIQNRLSEKGLPRGIAVLLYGAPGTGKTESAFQIARATGRRILHVDISEAKSCWFGESEKIVKKIFTNYKDLCKTCVRNDEKIPILLFNEADGILSRRKEIGSSKVDQTENAMQNIILEEMERLDGIMVATTNLADNLDAAFERRFLFKIKFENPSIEAKRKIWKSKLDWLSETDAESFARHYDLSGGQIDNIVRKVTMDEVLTGKLPTFAELNDLCKNERLGEAGKRIGFF